MPYRTSQKKREKSLEYYYKNREKVLEYQKERLKIKYRIDKLFKKKRQLRDKSRVKKLKIDKPCLLCESTYDLQRHHPDYKSIYFVILCRSCHNLIHYFLKECHSTSMTEQVSS